MLLRFLCFGCFCACFAFGLTPAQALGQDATTQEVPKQEVTKRSKTPVVVESINAAMQAFVDKGEISGAVTLVSQRGKVVHLGAVGMSNLERQKEMKPFHMFAVASMTKPIVSTAIMMLQEEGKLSVDDEVQKYLPAYGKLTVKDGSALKRPVTIRDCLTHTAGLGGSQVNAELPSLEALVDELAQRPLDFQPGEKWQYGPGLNVAGRIIEVVTEQPLDQFLAKRIFEPLKMNSTTFFPTKKQLRRVAGLYKLNNGELAEGVGFLGDTAKISHPNPSGGLFSTARDIQRFYQMILRGGKVGGRGDVKQLVSRKSIREMTRVQTGDLKTGFTPGNGWGLGWCVIQSPQGVTGMLSPGTYGHGGAFGTQVWVDPKRRTVFVLMIQRLDIGNSDGSDIRKAFQEAAVEAITTVEKS